MVTPPPVRRSTSALAISNPFLRTWLAPIFQLAPNVVTLPPNRRQDTQLTWDDANFEQALQSFQNPTLHLDDSLNERSRGVRGAVDVLHDAMVTAEQMVHVLINHEVDLVTNRKWTTTTTSQSSNIENEDISGSMSSVVSFSDYYATTPYYKFNNVKNMLPRDTMNPSKALEKLDFFFLMVLIF